MTSTTRRRFLKTTACAATAALGSSIPVLSAFASDSAPGSALPTCDITIYQQQSVGKESVTLMNMTGQPVMLDEINPVGLDSVNGRLAVRLNNVERSGVVLQPGQRLSFEIEAESFGTVDETLQIPNVLAGKVNITSDHPAFNGVIPVTVFDSQLA